MRISSSLLLLGVVLLGAACSSDSLPMPEAVRERFAGPVYQARVVNAEQRIVFAAARKALARIDFRYERGGAAQGRLSAIGRLSTGDDMRSSRQLTLEVHLTDVAPGTEVSVLFSEVREDDFNKNPGMGTSTPMKASALYDIYLDEIEQILATEAASS